MRLGCGFRQPNSISEFGASVKVTLPYGCNASSAQRRADVVIGPYGKERKPHQSPGPAAHSGASAPAVARDGLESEQRSPQKGPATPDNPSVSLTADSSLCTREPLGTGDADCRVASLLAMTVLNLCHSEEAQRADVGIRPFYDGRGFGPPRSSAPTGGCRALPRPPRQRSERGKSRWSNSVFARRPQSAARRTMSGSLSKAPPVLTQGLRQLSRTV